MREREGLWEYIATYVDVLLIVSKDLQSIIEMLQGAPYNFKLKGSGPISFHLGCGFERDRYNLLCINPKKYIEKMMQSFERMFGERPNKRPKSPLEDGDHPELDTSAFLNEDNTIKYQLMIGQLQWLITIGRFDMQTSTMTMSAFRAKPRTGHLERLRRMYCYVNRFPNYMIRFRTQQPDLSFFDTHKNQDWKDSIYGEHSEELPMDAPKSLGKEVTLIHYFDANLMHDVLTGKAVTGCIHFINKTPIMWYSKKQATTETATYGAEFCAGRTCIEQIVDLRNTLRYLGVPLHETSYVFGDNESMINSSKYRESKLHKRHNILSYHYVKSMISRGFLSLNHLDSKSNIADVVTKHWSLGSVQLLLKAVLGHCGDTAELLDG